MAEVFHNFAQNGNQSCTKPEDASKIFVGGLSWDTTQEKLNNYFSKYGEVVDCILMMDTATKRSRGFGFVTYKDPSSVIRVLDGGPHFLDNKSIDPKAAVPRYPVTSGAPKTPLQPSTPTARRCNKIFVGGIGQATDEDLRTYFQAFGMVTDVTIMMDKNTGRPRGFAFVGFETMEASERTAQIRYHNIKGKRVEVKVAQPRDTKGLEFAANGCPSSLNDSEDFRLENENFSDTNIDNPNSSDLIRSLRLNDSQITQYTKNTIVELLNDIWK